MTYSYDDVCLDVFLENQRQLFPEDVATDREEAADFLDMCMAVVCENRKEVKEYFDEVGLDIAEISLDELEEQPEVFALGDGRYLVVEG